MANSLKCVAISDTHDYDLRDLNIPDGDVLIHSGDATGLGTVNSLIQFNKQLGELPHKYKIVIAGNHDWLYEKDNGLARSILTNATYLENSAVVIDGIKFYGSPATPTFGYWAFMYNPDDIERIWNQIPLDTDVLVTHGPPYSILDNVNGRFVGCKKLLSKVESMTNLRYHIFGHIHEGHGTFQSKNLNTHFINASICDAYYQPNHQPIIFNVVCLENQ